MYGDKTLEIIEPHHYDRLEANDFEGVLITKKECYEIAMEIAEMRKAINKSVVSSDVISRAFDNFPENKVLIKDSGLFQLRSEDLTEVILQQSANESNEKFLEWCSLTE